MSKLYGYIAEDMIFHGFINYQILVRQYNA